MYNAILMDVRISEIFQPFLFKKSVTTILVSPEKVENLYLTLPTLTVSQGSRHCGYETQKLYSIVFAIQMGENPEHKKRKEKNTIRLYSSL